MRTARRWLKRAAAALALVIVLAVVIVVVTPQGRTAAKTMGLVLQVVPGLPVHPLSWFTGDPERTAITYLAGGADAQADLYRVRGDGHRAAIVLFLGVNPAGRDNERVVNLGNALARAGFVVLVPWSENMVARRVDPADIDLLVGAFEHLKSLDYVDGARIGGGGFCVGSSMLMIAASDPRIRDDVAFINFFSGYFDARDFLAQFAARETFYDGTREGWEPDSLTEQVFTRLLVDALPDQVESEALSRHFIAHEPLSIEERGRLSEGADAVFRLLSGTTLDEAQELISRLPVPVLEMMDALSPSRHIDNVTARLFVMHDREDALAPVEESMRLRDAVAGRDDTRYTEFSFFSHVDPGERVGLFGLVSESLKLYRHLYSVVRVAS